MVHRRNTHLAELDGGAWDNPLLRNERFTEEQKPYAVERGLIAE